MFRFLNMKRMKGKNGMVKRSDWKIIDMSEITEKFVMDYKLSSRDKISKNHETLCVTVNRDPEQHTETKIEGDKINLAILLNSLLNKSDGDLWEQHIEHIRNSVKEHRNCH